MDFKQLQKIPPNNIHIYICSRSTKTPKNSFESLKFCYRAAWNTENLEIDFHGLLFCTVTISKDIGDVTFTIQYNSMIVSPQNTVH